MVAQPRSTDLKMALFSSRSRKLPAYSSSVVSLPVCSIRSARVCAKRREVNKTNPSPASPKLKATKDLINGLKCEIANVQEDLERFHAAEDSDEFPFEIITRSGYGLKIKEAYLQRELDDEVIRVSAEYETDEDEDEEDDDDEDEVEEDDDDDEVEDEEDSGIAMKVNIFQKKYLANIQKELVKYLEVRGVTPKTIDLWKASLKNKIGRESVVNMKGFRAFMEKSKVFTSAN
ncbi:hypothetical protein ACLB2K_065470 [Fragaria x ananassa]